MNILIVDNEKAMLETLEKSLKIKGFFVQKASTVSGALEILGNSAVDMVITDYAMRKMTGLELARKIETIRKIPVILMTAHGDETLEGKARQNHCRGFLQKPFTLESLMNEINLSK